MRILVCGGRDYGDIASLNGDRDHPLWIPKEHEYNTIIRFLSELLMDRAERTDPDEFGNYMYKNVTIINGKARGVDSVSTDFAVVEWLALNEYPADWKKYGKAAGYIRNKQMLEEGKPDIVVAFPGGRGTQMMVELAEKAGVEVIKVGR